MARPRFDDEGKEVFSEKLEYFHLLLWSQLRDKVRIGRLEL